MKRFHTFCISLEITTSFPLAEHTLCFYAAYLANQNLAPQTIKSHLSALRNEHIALGFPDLRDKSSLPRLKRVQADISKIGLLGGRNNPRRIRLPITPTILRRMKAVLDTSPCRERLVVWAIACSAFFGFFRLGELLPKGSKRFDPAVDLEWGDVSLDNHDNPQMVQFHIKVSKCNQLGAGVDIVVGRTGKNLCPVAAAQVHSS